MNNRKEKIEELIENMASLRRNMNLRGMDFAKAPKITPSQWGMLMLIEHRTETSVKDVAAALHITSSAATQLADGLVKGGYVIRKEHEKDRRTVLLISSKKTKSQVGKMKKHAVQRFLKVFEALTDKEFEQYLALNKKIVKGAMSNV